MGPKSGGVLLTFLLRHAFTLLSRLREPDRYGLLSAFYFAAFPTPAAFRSASLIAPHLAFNVAARAGGIFALSFLRHWAFSKLDEIHLSPNRFSDKKLRNVCPVARRLAMRTTLVDFVAFARSYADKFIRRQQQSCYLRLRRVPYNKRMRKNLVAAALRRYQLSF